MQANSDLNSKASPLKLDAPTATVLKPSQLATRLMRTVGHAYKSAKHIPRHYLLQLAAIITSLHYTLT